MLGTVVLDPSNAKPENLDAGLNSPRYLCALSDVNMEYSAAQRISSKNILDQPLPTFHCRCALVSLIFVVYIE